MQDTAELSSIIPPRRDGYSCSQVRELLVVLVAAMCVLQVRRGMGHVVDVAADEAVANPDGGAIDSNPYSARILRDRALIADAGANPPLAVGLDIALGLDEFVYLTNHSTSAGRGEVWRIAR